MWIRNNVTGGEETHNWLRLAMWETHYSRKANKRLVTSATSHRVSICPSSVTQGVGWGEGGRMERKDRGGKGVSASVTQTLR